MVNPFKKIFSRKSKSEEFEADPKSVQQAGNDQEKLSTQAEDTAEQMDKKGDSKAAKKLREIAKKLRETPEKAMQELEKFINKEKLPSKNKKDMQSSMGKFKKSYQKLLDTISAKKIHKKHVKNVVLKFYKEVAISLKGSTGYFFFKPKTVGSGMEVDEDNIINIIIRKIDKSGLKKYATKHKKSSVYKWYEYLLENIEKISQELTAYESKLDMSDKIKLTKMLESVQEMMYNRTSELLDLEKYVDSHNIEKSSLGAVVHGNTYGLYRENVENIIKLRLKSLWVKCTELVGLEPPKYTG